LFIWCRFLFIHLSGPSVSYSCFQLGASFVNAAFTMWIYFRLKTGVWRVFSWGDCFFCFVYSFVYSLPFFLCTLTRFCTPFVCLFPHHVCKLVHYFELCFSFYCISLVVWFSTTVMLWVYKTRLKSSIRLALVVPPLAFGIAFPTHLCCCYFMMPFVSFLVHLSYYVLFVLSFCKRFPHFVLWITRTRKEFMECMCALVSLSLSLSLSLSPSPSLSLSSSISLLLLQLTSCAAHIKFESVLHIA
jgi:hypothetical protein